MADFERHPLSEQYGDIVSKAEFDGFVEDMKKDGFDPGEAIALFEGKILDGWQRYQVALAAGVQPIFYTFEGSYEEAERKAHKNVNRRHHSLKFQAKLRKDRKERMKAQRETGASLQEIADSEGVSKMTAQRVLKEVEEEEEEKTGTEEEVVDAPNVPKVGDRILCERCARTGAVKDCVRCKVAREEAKKEINKAHPKPPKSNKPKRKRGRPKKSEQEVFKDDHKNVIPARCKDAWCDETTEGIIETIEGILKAFTADAWTRKALDLGRFYPFLRASDFKKAVDEAKDQIKKAIETLKNGLPDAVCPQCLGADGVKCRGCRDSGLVPKYRYEELKEKP